MKKLVDISPLNKSSKLTYRCDARGAEGYIILSPPSTPITADPIDPSTIADLSLSQMQRTPSVIASAYER
jgi:hypothetical protein